MNKIHVLLGMCLLLFLPYSLYAQSDFQTLYNQAMSGNAVAQYNLGLCYLKGEGTDKNEKEALRWFRTASGKGIVEADYMMGYCYEYGIEVEPNQQIAFNYYRKAANADLPEAQGAVGLCYMQGIGVEKNEREGFKWLMKAAQQGIPYAQGLIGSCYENGTGFSMFAFAENRKDRRITLNNMENRI